jgi:hypothetical protein
MKQPPRPPQLVAERALERGEVEDLLFTAEQFDEFDQHFKRRLAGAADSDEISGRSTFLEIRAFFVVQRSLSEYAGQ